MENTQQYNRFKDAPWFSSDTPENIVIGGQGGIGSWLSLFMSRAGFSIVAYDDDLVEEHNIGGQLFKKDSAGIAKVTAVNNIVKELSATKITTFKEKITQDTPTHHFFFAAFDNMKARKDAFEVWKKSIPISTVTPIFIDGRLEMEQLQIFCVTPDKIAEYEQQLFDDSEVEEAYCTLKQTSHSAAMIASHMTAFFTNHITNIYQRQIIREVPFFYEYFIPANVTNEVPC